MNKLMNCLLFPFFIWSCGFTGTPRECSIEYNMVSIWEVEEAEFLANKKDLNIEPSVVEESEKSFIGFRFYFSKDSSLAIIHPKSNKGLSKSEYQAMNPEGKYIINGDSIILNYVVDGLGIGRNIYYVEESSCDRLVLRYIVNFGSYRLALYKKE